MHNLYNDPIPITGRRILITGVNGFVGCHAAVIATRAGAEVVGIDLAHRTVCGERIRASLGGTKIKTHEVDALSTQELTHVLSGFNADIIIHLAGHTARENTPEAWVESAKGNILSTSSVISAVIGQEIDSRPVLVMAGTQMEYGLALMPWTEKSVVMPDSPYGASKAAATELVCAAVRSKALRGCVVRFPLIFGPGQHPVMIVPELIVKALKGLAFQMTDGLQQRRFSFVGDAARFLLIVANSIYEDRKIPSLVNAPAYGPLSIIEIVRETMNLLPDHVELQVGALAKRPGELMQAWPDSSLAESMGIIDLTPMEESLALTVAWYRQNQWFLDPMAQGAVQS